MSDLKRTNRVLSEAVGFLAEGSKPFLTPDDKDMPADKFKALAVDIAEAQGFDPGGSPKRYGQMVLSQGTHKGVGVPKSYVYSSASLSFNGVEFDLKIQVEPYGKGFHVFAEFNKHYANEDGKIKTTGKTFELKSDNPVSKKDLANLRAKDFETANSF